MIYKYKLLLGNVSWDFSLRVGFVLFLCLKQLCFKQKLDTQATYESNIPSMPVLLRDATSASGQLTSPS